MGQLKRRIGHAAAKGPARDRSFAYRWTRVILQLAVICPFTFCPIGSAVAVTGTWTPLNHQPHYSAGTMLLLSDGSVMVSGGFQYWMKLTPDASGSYINGAWKTLAPMSTPRRSFASQVLQDGRVWVAGGEDSGTDLAKNWSGTAEIYNPVTNAWSSTATFPSQPSCDYIQEFGGYITSGSPVVTRMLSTAGFRPGWSVAGRGIPPNTTILSIDSLTQIHLSKEATLKDPNGVILRLGSATRANTEKGSEIVKGIPSTLGYQLGWAVNGPGIPHEAVISNILSEHEITISIPATSTNSAALLNFAIRMQGTSCLGDDDSMLLPDGSILVGDNFNNSTYFFDVATDSWSYAARRVYGSTSEQGWARLKGGSILAYDIGQSIRQGSGYAELYDPSLDLWSSISPADGTANGALPVLSESDDYELGPVLRLLDSRMLQIGANGLTALYQPATNTWAAGPRMNGLLNGSPFLYASDDAPGAELPNGHIIVAADAGLGVQSTGTVTAGSNTITGIPVSAANLLQVNWAVADKDKDKDIPTGTTITSVAGASAGSITISSPATASSSGEPITFGGEFSPPTVLFDFNPATNTIAPLSPAIPDSNLQTLGSFLTRMLVLPNGQLLFADASSQLWVYTPTVGASPSYLPRVLSVAKTGTRTYQLKGQQITGQSAGSSYGDDVQCDENYPIVSLVSTTGPARVYYARTTNWSTVDVATGATPETVQFTVGPSTPTGTYQLVVSAAGIQSKPFTFTLK